MLCKILVFFEFPSTGNLNFGLHFVGQGITETFFLALVCLCLRDHFIMGGLVLQELLLKSLCIIAFMLSLGRLSTPKAWLANCCLAAATILSFIFLPVAYPTTSELAFYDIISTISKAILSLSWALSLARLSWTLCSKFSRVN